MNQKDFQRILIRAILLPVVLVALVAGIFLWQISRLLAAAQWVDHTNQVIAQAYELQKLLVDMETGVRGYLVAGNPSFLEPYERALPQVDPSFERLSNLVADNPAQVQRLAEIRPVSAKWQHYARDVIAMRDRGEDYQAYVNRAIGKDLMDTMRAQSTSFIQIEENLRNVRTRATRRAVWVAIGAVIALTLVLGGFLAYIIRRQLLSLSQTYGRALEIAEEARSVAETLAAEVTGQNRQVEQALMEARVAKERAERRVTELELAANHRGE